MSEWKECRIEDIAKLSKKSWKVGDISMPYIGLEHIEEAKLRLNGFGKSEDVASNKYYFQAGDTLFGKLRPYFRKVVKPNFDGICSTDIWVITPQKDIDKNFLFYFFTNQELVELSYSTSGGTRMPRADWDFLSQTVWNIPPNIEQKAIGEVLSSLDNKIDLLHCQNRTLEELAQTFFRQWFIEEGKDEWEIKFSDAPIQIIDGDRGANYPKNSDFFNNEYCLFLSAKNVTKNGFDFVDCSFITKEKDELLRKGKLSRNDIVLTTRGTVGNIAYYHQLIPFDHIRINSGMVILRADETKISPLYLYVLMKSSLFSGSVIEHTSGSAQPQLPIRDLNNVSFILPPQNLYSSFMELIEPIYFKVFSNQKQIESLENLRDTLLPKLLSGEVRVKI